MRSRLPLLLAVCLVLATVSGCVGQLPDDDAGAGVETTSQTTTATTDTNTSQRTPTTTFSDAKAHEVVNDIRAKQENISTYHAVEVEKRIYHLPNGSTYTRTKKVDRSERYADGTKLLRVEYLHPTRNRIIIENRTNTIAYESATNTYDVSDRRDGPAHYYISGVYEAKHEFEAAFDHDALTYHGKTHVLGHEVYVIEFDNPQKHTERASWYNSTFWIDAQTGALVKSKTNYPLPFDQTLDQIKNGFESGHQKSTNATVIHNGTVVSTYRDLAVNQKLTEGTFAPTKNATRED